MHFPRKVLSLVLALCLIVSMAPGALAAEGAAAGLRDGGAALQLTGNTGAVLTCSAAPLLPY